MPDSQTVIVELTREQAEALAFPITQPTLETMQLAEDGRERIRTKLYKLYR